MSRNMSLDVLADNASTDSLSFAGLVCIQDQQRQVLPLPPSKSPTRIQKPNQDFEFGSTPPRSTTNSPAHVLFPNGPISPKAVPLESNQSQVVLAKFIMQDYTRNEVIQKNKLSKKTKNEVRNNGNEKCSGGNNWFQSFAIPCRNCRAIEPSSTVKEDAIRSTRK